MRKIKLVALDLDGTLFNSQTQIPNENIVAIKEAMDKGVHVVISTGRPLIGVPFDKLECTGMDYAITANGAAVYKISTGECIFEDPMEAAIVIPAIDFVLSHSIHMDAFIGGLAYSPVACMPIGENIAVPEHLRAYIMGESRKRIDDLRDFIIKDNKKVQKITTNYMKDENGNLIHRDDMADFLESTGNFTAVSGGYNNLEFTKKGVNKGRALNMLAKHLGVDIEETMAVGDTENDLSIIQAAGFGVAMGNATEDIKAASDYVTLSNDESGVAAAIRKFVL